MRRFGKTVDQSDVVIMRPYDTEVRLLECGTDINPPINQDTVESQMSDINTTGLKRKKYLGKGRH